MTLLEHYEVISYYKKTGVLSDPGYILEGE